MAEPAGLASHLSADAAEFVPCVAKESDLQQDLIARLPERSKQMLRSCFQDWQSGEWFNYYVGTLKSYNNTKGFGFLECADAAKDWGCDVYVHKNLVPTPWTMGQPVEFAVTQNSRGQPQAMDVNWLPKLAVASRPPVQSTPEGVAPADALAMRIEEAAQKKVEEVRYIGTLKSFSATQGYGFLQSDAIMQKHRRDVYFDKSQLVARYTIGQLVEFGLGFNAKGNPQAKVINWEPVMFLPRWKNEAPRMEGSQRQYASKTLERLQKLLKQIPESMESTFVSAIDFQGTAMSSGEDNEEVDYLNFVLQRYGSPERVADELKDFVQMLLLLMIAKMLRRPWINGQEKMIVDTFEALSRKISNQDKAIQSHFVDVTEQIKKHIEHAKTENPTIFEEKVSGEAIEASVKRLQDKARTLQSGTTSSVGRSGLNSTGSSADDTDAADAR